MRAFPVPSLRKAAITLSNAAELRAYGLRKGDQVKVTVKMPRSQFGTWDDESRAITSFCEKEGIYLASIKLEETLTRKRFADLGTVSKAQLSADPKVVLSTYAKGRKIEKGLLRYADEVME